MKFAKKLQEELYPDWIEKYIDYKKMKKVLKLEDDEASHLFHSLFQSQVLKVHEFMAGHQEQIIASISPLELNLGSERDLEVGNDLPALDLNHHCEELVKDIRIFKDYASLNLTAIRKIIKKFDKRFHTRFHDMFGQSTKTKMMVTDRDIGMWLLFPAQQCLKLMRLVIEPSYERPIRQYNFWVDELRTGSEIARRRVMGYELGDPTQIRLVMHGNPEDLSLCIKNTFIDCHSDTQQSPTARRAHSGPPAPRLVVHRRGEEESPDSKTPAYAEVGIAEEDLLSLTPVVNVEHFICQTLRMAPPPRILHDEVVDTDCDSPIEDLASTEQLFARASSSRSYPRSRSRDAMPGTGVGGQEQETIEFDLPRAPSSPSNYGVSQFGESHAPASSSSSPKWISSQHERVQFSGNHEFASSSSAGWDTDEYGRYQFSTNPAPPSCNTGYQPSAHQQQADTTEQQRRGYQPPLHEEEQADITQQLRRGKSSNNTTRWWTQATFCCPISGFPISMLPYPPYKFTMRKKAPPVLVDGPYLVLEVIASWNWDILGRPLLVADVASLDAYMKRCKLGPFRLGRALELLSKGTPQAQRELEDLRAQSRRKLDNLKHVQKVRRQQPSKDALSSSGRTNHNARP